MKKIIGFSLLLVLGIGQAQNAATPVTMEHKETADLLGKITKTDLQKAPYNLWFTPGFDGYRPDAATILKLKPLAKDIKITIFMGTWCEDSQHQVPGFYKILGEAGFNGKNITLIVTDKSKKTPQKFEDGKNITNVPTFIIARNGKEIQRIVESPVETLEKDLLKILSGQKYLHPYER